MFRYLVIFLATLLCCSAWAQDTKFEIGDEVTVPFLGQETAGKIIDINQAGWYYVEVNFIGTTTRTFVTDPSTMKKRGGNNSTDNSTDAQNPLVPSSDQQIRTWSDSTGKFKIDAKLIGIEKDQVQLEKADGVTVKLPLAKLSKEDRDFVAGGIAESTLPNDDSAGHNTPKDKGIAKSDSETASSLSGGTESPPTKLMVFKKKPSTPTIPKSNAVQPVWLPDASVGIANRVIPLTGLQKVFKTEILVDRKRTRCFLRVPSVRAKVDPAFLCDLLTGETRGPYQLPNDHVPLAYDGAQNLLLTTIRMGGGHHHWANVTLYLWKFAADDQIELVDGFEWDNQHLGRPTSGQFIDNGRVAITGSNFVEVWDLDKKSASHFLTFDRGCNPSISPNGKYVYASVGGKFVIVDLSNGKTVGACEVPKYENRIACGVRPDGKQVAFVYSNRIEIRDLGADKTVADFTLSEFHAGYSVEYLDDEHILLDNFNHWTLISVPLQSEVWNYNWRTNDQSSVLANGKRIIVDVKSEPISLVVSELPHVDARNFIGALNANELIALKTGDDLSLDLPSTISKPMQDRLIQGLVTSGYRIVPESERVLRLTIGNRETTQARYRIVGGAEGTSDQTVAVNTQALEFALYKNDEKLWWISGASGNAGADNIRVLEAGQTLAEAANQYKTTPDDFVQRITIGKQIARRPNECFYGSTDVTSEGLAQSDIPQ